MARSATQKFFRRYLCFVRAMMFAISRCLDTMASLSIAHSVDPVSFRMSTDKTLSHPWSQVCPLSSIVAANGACR